MDQKQDKQKVTEREFTHEFFDKPLDIDHPKLKGLPKRKKEPRRNIIQIWRDICCCC